MPYSHRLALQQDLPDIVRIYNSTISCRNVTADLAPITVESRLSWFEEHASGFRPLWVVEDQQAEISGWLSFSSFNPRAAYDGTAELSIYLREDARGKGLGKYLLLQAIAHAPRIGVHTLVGLIFADNQPSLELFRSCGFECWASLPRVAMMDGVDHDLVIVGKRVQGPTAITGIASA